MQKCIAVDIDEVLVPFFNSLAQYHQKRVNKQIRLPLKYKYHYASVLDLTEDESSELVRSFYGSEDHASMPALPGSVWALNTLKSKGYSVVLVTGRQRYSKDATESLLCRLYGNTFDDIIYCDHYTEFSKNKSHICDALGARCIVDDSFSNCVDCMKIGIPAFNFIGNPTYPWCDPSSISVGDWENVVKKIL
tara:strand:+ start:515 stop:1090 length:576 start_codon:yes stop_codon:yes gene_type:complete